MISLCPVIQITNTVLDSISKAELVVVQARFLIISSAVPNVYVKNVGLASLTSTVVRLVSSMKQSY
jgi:hypothetical protein